MDAPTPAAAAQARADLAREAAAATWRAHYADPTSTPAAAAHRATRRSAALQGHATRLGHAEYLAARG